MLADAVLAFHLSHTRWYAFGIPGWYEKTTLLITFFFHHKESSKTFRICVQQILFATLNFSCSFLFSFFRLLVFLFVSRCWYFRITFYRIYFRISRIYILTQQQRGKKVYVCIENISTFLTESAEKCCVSKCGYAKYPTEERTKKMVRRFVV